MTLPMGVFYDGPAIGKQAFGTRIEDDSLSPHLNPGDIVICDPEQKPETGDLCVAVVGDDAFIRVFDSLEGNSHPHARVRALNDDYPSHRFNDGDFVVAKCLYRFSELPRFQGILN